MKKILTILLGLSLCSPMFAQSGKQKQIDSIVTQEVDSVNVDRFVIMLVDYAYYNAFDTLKNIGTKIHNDKLYTVYFYRDSIVLKVVNLNPKNVSAADLVKEGDYELFGLVGGNINFYKMRDHWYYFCPKRQTDWMLNRCLPDIHRALISP